MKVGILLAIGESWADFKNKGQDKLFIEERLKPYSENFKETYVFSYANESGEIIPGVKLLGNKFHLHRYIYAFLMPIFYRKTLKELSLIRGMQLSGGIPGIVAKIFYGKKVIINYGYDYTAVARSEKQIIRTWLYKFLEGFLLPFIDGVIVTTPFFYSKIKKICKEKVYLIPNSVDTTLFKPLKVFQKSNIILFVGRLERQKNLFMLIDAVSSFSNLQLQFIGRGSLKDELLIYAQKKQVRLEIVDSVRNDVLSSYYNKAKVFVLPSLLEGHPKALLEAMSCGLPVIGTDVVGIRGIINNGENGLLIAINRQSLSSAIGLLINSISLRERLGNQARKIVLNNFDRKYTRMKEVKLITKLAD